MSRKPPNLYVQKDLKQKWNLSKEPSVNSASRHARPEMSEKISWYNDELQWYSVKSQLELAQNCQRCHRYIPDDKSLRPCGSFDHISSLLLWYRLTILTGEPKNVTTDNYKFSWDIKFYHMDSVSTLRLWNSKGGARAAFSGLKASQDDALGFVNYLTRSKFPHT